MRRWLCMKRVLGGLVLGLALFLFIGTEVAAMTGKTVRVAVDTANVRKEPAKTAEVIHQVTRGDTYTVADEKFGWYKIKLANGKDGWIAGYIVVDAGSQKNVTANTFNNGIVTADSLYVRDQAGVTGKITGVLQKGAEVKITAEANGWKKVSYGNNSGWINGKYLTEQAEKSSNNKVEQSSTNSFVYIITEGTNLRSKPNMSGEVIAKGSVGERYPVVGKSGDWYKITLVSGKEVYVASSVVSTSEQGKKMAPAKATTSNLAGKTIVLDPGHGGHDPGTGLGTGIFEKNLTLQTAKLLESKLTKAGANVVLTRKNDKYVSLETRVDFSNRLADAFISIHFDAAIDTNVNGYTVFYNQSYQEKFAQTMNQSLANHISLKNRGTVVGDYLVVRENNHPAVLLELGFLSNPAERSVVTSNAYQEQVTDGIVAGLQNYFK